MTHAVEHLNIRVVVLGDDDNEYAGHVRAFAQQNGRSSALVKLDHPEALGGWFLTSELKPEASGK